MADENKLKAKKQFDNMTDLITRMESDADLVNLVAKYKKIPDVNGKAIDNSVYITLNDAAMFAWKVETLLNSAIEQVAVTTESKRFDTVYVEDFIKAIFKEADKLLPLKDLYPFNPFIDQQTCRRGRVAARCLCRIEEGELIPEITPFDTKYFTYWMDKKGLAGSAYKTTRSADQIESEYPDATVPTDTQGKGIEVLDIWTPKVNEVWIASDKQVLNKPFKLGYVPVVFHKVPMGSMLLDTDTLALQGESIFFLFRDLMPELNRFVSIIQSLNLKELDHALQLGIPQDRITKDMPVKSADELTEPGIVNVVSAEGGGYKPMPIGELRQMAELLHRMIQDRIDRSTQSFIQSMLQPRTATEIIGIAQEKGDVITPRLATRGFLKQGLAEMAIKQTIQAAKEAKVSSVKLGNREFEISKLTQPPDGYEIEFKYYFKDPKMDAARASIGASLRGVIPDKSIRRDTLQREDPEKDERELNWEESARLFPLVKMNRLRRSTGEEADKGEPGAEEELKLITLEMIPAIKQAIAGQMTPEQPEEVKPEQPVVPALGRTPSA